MLYSRRYLFTLCGYVTKLYSMFQMLFAALARLEVQGNLTFLLFSGSHCAFEFQLKGYVVAEHTASNPS
jgi:hypothetical protein